MLDPRALPSARFQRRCPMNLVLVAIVTLAFTTEAAMGFGATLIALGLGALVTSIDALLPAIVPLNAALSLAIVLRARRSVDVRLLAARVLPAMALGFPLGLLAFERLPRASLQRGFAVFVLVLAALELARRAGPERALSRRISVALLALGGVAHGAFATGGPPVVYVCARTLPEKAAFRATMSALWLVLNGALLVAYAVGGRLDASTLRQSATLAPGLLVGLWAGEALHGKIPERGFRGAVFALLFGVGLVLLVRA